MSCIVLIGGIIGAGKSTLINFIYNNAGDLYKFFNIENESPVSNISNTHRNTYKVIFDNICPIEEQAKLMKTLRGWKNFRADLLMAAEHFIASSCEYKLEGPLTERGHNLLSKIEESNDGETSPAKDGIFLIEDNFYYRSMRYEWFQMARRANIGFCEVFLDCPLDVALQRNSSRGYQIPEQKIRMMMSSIEYPNPEKYKWEKYSIRHNTVPILDLSSLQPIMAVIQEAIEHPAEMLINEDKVKAQQICSKNAVHQADRLLRRIVSRKIDSYKEISPKDDLKSLISSTISARQELLSDIRQGQVDFPEELLKDLQKSGIGKVQQEYEVFLNELFDNMISNKLADMNLRLLNLEIKDSR